MRIAPNLVLVTGLLLVGLLLPGLLLGACTGTPARPATGQVPARSPEDAPRFANSASRQPVTPREHVSPEKIDLRRFAGGDPPVYPEDSVRAEEQGVVGLRFELLENGHVRELGVETSSGHARLDSAALSAARTWRFNPTTGGGDVEVIRYRLEFRLVDG